MTESTRRTRRRSFLALAGLLVALAIQLPGDVHGFGIGIVMNSKSLPEATVAVIDPESGTSSGGGVGDVRLAVGDILLFRFAFAPVPDASNYSMQAYLTEYLPPNTEVVGVRFIDSTGRTIEPRASGVAVDGCVSAGGRCTDFSPRSGGSIAQLHADTGAFFSSDARISRTPDDRFVAIDNGILMDPPPLDASDIVGLFGLSQSADLYTHNEWDWDQVQAFGNTAAISGNGGDGNTPYKYGSPVAGPQTFYLFEATDNAGSIDLSDQVGPWQRIEYPGAQVGIGNPAAASPPEDVRVGVEAATATHCGTAGNQPCIGTDVTPANPAAATAVRFAAGEARAGEPVFAEVALRVTGVPLDPSFLSGPENLNCSEAFGSGLSTRLSGGFGSGGQNKTGSQNPWALHVPTQACVFLKVLLDVQADKPVADNELVTYTLRVRNLSLNPQTNVVVRQQFLNSRVAYVPGSASRPPDSASPTTCPAPDNSKDCLTWTLGSMQPSDEVVITTRFNSGGGGGTSAVMDAVFVSDQLPGEGFRTQDLTLIDAVALPDAALDLPYDELTTFTAPNSTIALTGTVDNTRGTAGFTGDAITFQLPSGWTVSGDIVVGGVSASCHADGDCTGSTPTFDLGNLDPGESAALSLTVNVGNSPTGLYDIDIQLWGGQSGVGGDFETLVPAAVTVPVGAVRTAPPAISCPVQSTAPSVAGTSEADASIDLLFNLMLRGVDAADASGNWEVTSYDAGRSDFGQMYGGLELRARATAPGKLVSELSEPCETTPSRECSDGLDNDGDGVADFPADTGCDGPLDNDESDAPQCSDGEDNNGAGGTDWPVDPSCDGPLDETEDGVPACSDGIDNDLDGDTDAAEDADCAGDPNGVSEAALLACMNRVDDDVPADGAVDFPDDPGCHSSFDDEEFDVGFSPEQLEARLLIVFDTSGSMNFNTCTDDFSGGDGSVDFPGADVTCADLQTLGCDPDAVPTPAAFALCDNGEADDSRLFQVKGGISDVVANFGEVDWALMRFKQRPVNFQPPTANASLASGGWQGGGVEPCQGFNEGEVVVGFDFENARTILNWINGETNYPAGAPPAALDWELRGSGTTPLAGALQSARNYIAGVKGDDDRSCRPYRVVLVTDGLETCGGDPAAEAATLYEPAGLDTPVVVIGFSTGDGATQTALNSIARAGSGGVDDAIFVDDRQALAGAFARIVRETLVFETCNGLDDDCDNATDEDFVPPLGDVCSNGALGQCARDGAFVCTGDGSGVECDAPTPAPTCADESCDGCNALDDDCDGKVNEGIICNCITFEVCNGSDDDCDGTVDEEVAGVGASCGNDVGECAPGTVQCVDPDGDPGTANSSLECVGFTGPADGDGCDGLDNDCDARIDEGPLPQCYDSGDGGCIPDGGGGFDCAGICGPGVRACVDPDSDPDTPNSVPGACVGEDNAQAEVCNGIDDNCDGTPDDPWAPDPNGNRPGDSCDNGLPGACNAPGVFTCDPGDNTAPELICTAPVVSPAAEVCNSEDDDCDGAIDEGDGTTPPPPDGLGAPVGDSCGPPGCSPGILACVDHDTDPETPNEIRCVGTDGGSEEVCNAFDDDCDGAIDEAIDGVDADCYPAELPGCSPDGQGGFDCAGQCAPGSTLCLPPEIVCRGFVGPEPIDGCDNEDDDCDGLVDEDASCPDGGICIAGECGEKCASGEFPCPFGAICKSFPDEACEQPPCNYCVADPCLEIECPEGELCDSDTGSCFDPCDGISCRDGEVCERGVCLDCFDPGQQCGGACEICEADMDGVGRCVIDPCCDVECEQGQFCREGGCVDTTCDPPCDSGSVCVEGVCVADPCRDVTCLGNQICNQDTGECQGDVCSGVSCGPGRVCNPGTGMCIADPCLPVDCPGATVCEVDFGGRAQCVEPPGERIVAAGGGCSVPGDGRGGAAPWFLGLALLLARRRRGRAEGPWSRARLRSRP